MVQYVRVDEIEVLNALPGGDATSAIVDEKGEVYLRDPWEGRLHPALYDQTTPGSIRIVEAIYEGDLRGEFEHTTVHLLALEYATPHEA